jgi:hypothetical protein
MIGNQALVSGAASVIAGTNLFASDQPNTTSSVTYAVQGKIQI